MDPAGAWALSMTRQKQISPFEIFDNLAQRYNSLEVLIAILLIYIVK